MKKFFGIILCAALLLSMASCAAKSEPVTLMPEEAFESKSGLTLTVDSFAPSEGSGLVLIEANAVNNSEQEISLEKTLKVTVSVDGTDCTGADRAEEGMTKGIGFRDTVAAGEEALILDLFKLPGTKYMPLTVTVVFSKTGETAVWKFG